MAPMYGSHQYIQSVPWQCVRYVSAWFPGLIPHAFSCVFCFLSNICCTGLRRRSVCRVRRSVRSFIFDGALAVYDDGFRGRGPNQICVEDGHVRNGIIQGNEARKDGNDGGTAATGRAAAFGRPRRRLRFFRGADFRWGRRFRPVAELWHAGGKSGEKK